MNLAIDIGNSRTKAGFFEGGKLVDEMVFDQFSAVELAALLESNQGVERGIIGSVGQYLDWPPDFQAQENFIQFSRKTPLPIRVDYHTPETLGLDRLAAVIGARDLITEGPLLVIDAGTCITYDLLSDDDIYLGGGISPGIGMRFEALHNYTARLPLVDWTFNEEIGVPGKDTVNSMKVGVLKAVTHELEGFIHEYSEQWEGLKVVITGGDSKLFEKPLKNSIFANSNLVLSGLNKILSYNCEG